MTTASLGLAPEDLETVLKIVSDAAPIADIWAFGSRVNGKARPFSDLDLAIVQETALEFKMLAELRYTLSESSLPVKVDVVEWATAKPAFREIIQAHHIVLKSRPAAA